MYVLGEYRLVPDGGSLVVLIEGTEIGRAPAREAAWEFVKRWMDDRRRRDPPFRTPDVTGPG